MNVDLYAGTVGMAVWLSKDLGVDTTAQFGGPERGVSRLDAGQPSGNATLALCRW